MKSHTVKIVLFVILIFGGINSSLYGQDTIQKTKLNDIIKFKGYIKDLQATSFSTTDSMSTYGYLHNRLNFKFYPVKNVTAALEIRNRIYYGEQIQNTPGFGKLLNTDNGYYKLSSLVINEKSITATSMIDRLWIDWVYTKWEIRVGRQRINWGKTLIWNPNDLFNTFNYANFDYEEQPGSDAIKLSYYPSGMSAIELAFKPGRSADENVVAGIWKFNKHNYDIQVLGGLYFTDLAIGTGWAGNIKNAGFKGEATWFQPKDKLSDTSGVLSAALTADYSFKKPIYIQIGVLYNSHPAKQVNNLFFLDQSTGRNLSAKNLMPTDFSFFGELSAEITPLLHSSLSAIYGLDPDFIFIIPTIDYSISDNWDISLIGQGVYFTNSPSIKNYNSIFLRLKWSF